MTDHGLTPAPLDVVVLGCGGAIGSQVVPLLARMPFIRRLVLVDRDDYETSNILTQNIEACNVGLPKARVQAGRVRRINRAIDVAVHYAAMEDLPWGELRGDVMLCCLDSRDARISVNEIGFRLGISWIDAAIDAAGLLVRVRSYSSRPESACLECRFAEADYNLIEQFYPCQGSPGIPATAAPAELAAMAASLQVAELRKYSAPRPEKSLLPGELLMDLRYHRQYLTCYRKNPACRFDHTRWETERLDVDFDAGFGEFIERFGPSGTPAIRVAGQSFARRLSCPECGRLGRTRWHLAGRIAVRTCRRCRAQPVATALDLFDALEVMQLPGAQRRRSLRSFGFRHGEIVSFETSAGSATHYQLEDCHRA